MVGTTLGIIGTAGRGSDAQLLGPAHFDRMVAATTTLILKKQIEMSGLSFVSGGAAWADHVAVYLTKLGAINPADLILFLPAFLGKEGFYGTDARSEKTAGICNYYHRKFTQVTGVNGIEDLIMMREHGAQCHEGTAGFHARNAQVAKQCHEGHLLAFTVGSQASTQADWTIRSFAPEASADACGLKDGGTAHTWNTSKTAHKYHVRLGRIDDSYRFL